ncbi:MAG: hypothetical protein MZV64_42290 [Ignavibacteriales bacterium]|nr:hypothetical protein [Ignavibacteriales bacterium]
MISRPKSVASALSSDVEQHVAREHVDAHRGDERLVVRMAARTPTRPGCSRPISRQALRVRLLLEAGDLALAGRTGRCPSRARRRGGHRLRRDGDVGAAFDVRVDQLREVHAVEVVAGEDQVVVRVGSRAKCRAACRTASAVPWNQFGLSGVCSAARMSTKPPENMSIRYVCDDVPVERGRVELRQDEDPAQLGVQAVADRDVDQPVLAADRHRGLRAHDA